MKRILLDMDGVLADFTRFLAYHFRRIDLLTHWPKGCTKIEDALGMTKQQMWDNIPKNTFAALLPTDEFHDILELVAAVDPFYHICTSPGPWAWSATDKINWLRKYIDPKFQRYIVVKDKTCCAKRGAILIDDKSSNIDLFIAEGGQGILVPRPWNRDHQLSEDTLNIVRIRLKGAFESSAATNARIDLIALGVEPVYGEETKD